MYKWLALLIWIVYCIVFFYGQLNASPDYHLLPNSSWGKLLGTTVILGIVSFILFFVLLIIEKKKSKGNGTRKEHGKYNFSFSRVVSRLILTFILGVSFGILMMPFLRTADGLLYPQRVAIGGENMFRAVFLWGVFTLIVALFTFWQKRFRMVSVLLLACWVLALIAVLSLMALDRNEYSCNRATAIPIPQEINRSLDLISQRMGIDNSASGTILQSAYDYRNCLDIQYSDTDSNTFEGYFQAEDDSNLQNLTVRINPSYKNYDDLTLATLLVHELIHVGQHINKVINIKETECFESEAEAFLSQSIFTSQLNDEEKRSIYTRLQQDLNINPQFNILLNTDQRVSESYEACSRLKYENNLSDIQFNECVWTDAQNRILQDVQQNEYYKSQCENR